MHNIKHRQITCTGIFQLNLEEVWDYVSEEGKDFLKLML